MHKYFIGLLFLLFPTWVWASDGLLVVKSAYDVSTTADKFAHALQSKGMTLFARIDHAAGASKVGKHLAATKVLIFGNPKIGTLLMQCERKVAIDLPQKALIWQDDADDVWLAYNNIGYLVQRHHIQGCANVIKKIEKALASFARAATH
jgi:uncharacterized protein (DUF302 family)